MRLEDMSFTDYLTAEFDLREMQRKERMKKAEFEKYAKEHNLFICTTNILEQIRAEIEFEVDHRTYMVCAEDVFAILDKYTKGETNVNT